MTETLIRGEPIYYAHMLSTSFKELLLVPIADIHEDNPLHSSKHLSRTINFISEHRNAYGIFIGDMIEAVLKTSKGDIWHQTKTPKEQAKAVIKKFMPIKKKLLGCCSGNHEARVYDAVGDDYAEMIADELGIPYRAEGIALKISFGTGNQRHPDRPYTYFIYATHGYGGARTKSAKAVKVERVATWLHADCYIMAHDHVVNVSPDVYLMPDPRTRLEVDKDGNETGFTIGSFTAHRKMLVKTNAYLKWGGYSERGGFPPTDLETPIIKLAGIGKPRIKVEV